MALGDLYGEDAVLTLASDEKDEKSKRKRKKFDDKKFTRAARLLYQVGQFTPEMMSEPAVMGVIEETYGALAEAIDSSLRHETPDNVRHALQENAFIFSGFKTYHSLREVGLSLTDEKGDIKPFDAFLGDVKRINELYNHNYLYAEYNHAVASALMADKWKQYEADGDKYYLQYRTANDDRVRETHRALHGTTLPLSDEFWDSFLPPNGWNCFVGGTPVLTQNGWRSIESIRRGDLVVGGSGKLKEVIGTHAKLVDEELVCILTKGAHATCTPNHRFCTPHGWVSAENLKPGDIIIQVGEVSAFHLFVHAIANTCTLLRYGLMACIRKRKSMTTLTINNKVESGNPSETTQFYEIPAFCGIKDVHAFNGFHSFFDFLRNTFFHNRYVLVEDKNTKKRRETIVYNLSVCNDESYVVPIGITHNCRCTTVQVRKEDYQPSDHDLSMKRGNNVTEGAKNAIFRFNPGKTLRLFPPKHPYFPKNCGECKRNLNLSYDPKREKCQVCGIIHAQIQNNTDAEKRILNYNEEEWERTHTSLKGGFVVTQRERIAESKASKAERKKFDKEMRMCMVLADNGHDVEYLKGENRPTGQTYDIHMDGIKADLKCITKGAGNIVTYARKALKEQGAEAVIFEFPTADTMYFEALAEARRKLSGQLFFYILNENILKEVK